MLFPSKFSFTFFLITTVLSLAGQESESQIWNKKYDKEGIMAFTRKLDGTPYLEYKIETILNATTIEKTLSLITNIDNYKVIFPYLDKVEMMRDDLPESYDVLVVIKTPFPVKNRIGVYTNRIIKNNNSIHINISQNNELIPATKYVEIQECYGSWLLNKIDDNSISIIHTFYADPGGSIPAWIINSFALKQPINTFKIIKRILSSFDNQ